MHRLLPQWSRFLTTARDDPGRRLHKLSNQLAAHVERLLGRRVLGWRSVPRGGWSIAHRGVFELEGGDNVFAKLGDVPDTIAAIRTECKLYPLLAGPFVPRLIAADPDEAVIVLEDLSAATWPPPWTAALLAGLENLFVELAATAADPDLPTLANRLREWGAWERVAADPSALLAVRRGKPRLAQPVSRR